MLFGAIKDFIGKYGWHRTIRIGMHSLFLWPSLRWPRHGRRERRLLSRVLRSRQWGGFPSPNRYAKQFADEFAAYHDARFGICTTSGSSALFVAYQAAGLQYGDEIIVPALTFSATATSALLQGIRPVFVDVDPGTLCLDPGKVSEAISEKTRAVVAVHMGAHMADMDALMTIGRTHGLMVIEDCAHAHGARWRGQGAGSLGNLGCFSFESSKTMSAGEGGIILTSDETLADRCHAYINCGRSQIPDYQPQTFLGLNHRITEWQAAVLLAQLERLPGQARRRHENMQLMSELLAGASGIRTLGTSPNLTTQSGYRFYFRYLKDECNGISREDFVQDLWEHGVPAKLGGYYPVYHAEEFGWQDAPIDVDYSQVYCPVAEQAAYHEMVCIPHWVFLARPRHIKRIAARIADLVHAYRVN